MQDSEELLQPRGTDSDPLQLLSMSAKTTLTVPGGLVLGFGPGPGLGNAIFWNRIGSLFSCYRPSVARLTLFDITAADQSSEPLPQCLRWPAPLQRQQSLWEPAWCQATYSSGGVSIYEERFATSIGLICRLKLSLSKDSAPRRLALFFHGQVEQWPIFDFTSTKQGSGGKRVDAVAPLVNCAFESDGRRLTVTQPHVHEGLPPVSSIQTLQTSREMAAWGFALNESDLRCLWEDYGCLPSLKLRLGQVGGRYPPVAGRVVDGPAAGCAAEFSHRNPLYYFAVTIDLASSGSEELVLSCDFHTSDPGGDIRAASNRAAFGTSAAVTLPSSYQLDVALGTQRLGWEQYFQHEVPKLECSDSALVKYWYYVWYVLRANRTMGGKHIQSNFTSPSKYLYWGPWIWDAYFHVLGEMWLQDQQIARNSIRAVLQMQFPNGYIPVCSGSQYRMCFHESVEGYEPEGGGGFASYVLPALKDYTEDRHPFEASFHYQSAHGKPSAMARTFHNEKTQTPLITLAAAEFCRLRGDASFAREVLPALWAYEQWLWRRRTDEQGRFILWHGDESGWDNATRHYPVPSRPVDVQVHCLLHRWSLAYLARLAGNSTIEAEARSRASATRETISSYWSAKAGMFLDLDGASGKRHRHEVAPSGLMPLLLGRRVDPEQIEGCISAISDPARFGTAFPLPTLAARDPAYSPHSWGWNGPAWLQVNYFTIVGLLECRRFSEAYALWERTRELFIRDGQPHSYELYDSELGTGVGCPDYSWQAMINHLIIHGFAGVALGRSLLKPALPPGMDELALSGLPGQITSVAYKRSGKTLQLSVSLRKRARLSLDLASLGAQVVIEQGSSLWEQTDDIWQAAAPQKSWSIIVRWS